MTLSTLRTMNVQMDDLRDSLSIRPGAAQAGADATAAKASPPHGAPGTTGAAQPPPAAGVDPMKWWGALTKQFTELASAAVQDSTKHATPPSAKAHARGVAQGASATGSPLKKVAPARKAAAPRRKRGAATGTP